MKKPIRFKFLILSTPIAVAAAIALWWNAPAWVNGSHPAIGFSMDILAITLIVSYGGTVWQRCRYAMHLRDCVFQYLRYESEWTEYLDCPRWTKAEINDRLSIYKSEPYTFDRPLHVLLSK